MEALWLICSALLVESWLPGSRHRVWLLRAFGARIGEGVRAKPRLRVKFPWRLQVGARSWIGEGVWIDNLAPVEIGADCCISQGVYLCTGGHDWSRRGFDLITKPITLSDAVWIGAKAIVGPGVSAGAGAVLTLGSRATKDLAPWTIHDGFPCAPLKARIVAGVGAQNSAST